jgi:hypothetical protein
MKSHFSTRGEDARPQKLRGTAMAGGWAGAERAGQRGQEIA